MEFGAPPDVASAMNGGAGMDSSASEHDDDNSTTPPGSSAVFPGMSGGGNATNPFGGQPGMIPGQNPGGTPGGMPGPTGPTIGLRESLRSLGPQPTFAQAWEQVFGGKTDQQKQAEQAFQANLQKRIEAARADWEAYKQRRQVEEKQRVTESLQMKDSLLALAPHLRGGSVGWSTTTQGDLSEQSLLQQAIKDAQAAKQREAAAAQMRAQQQRAQPKGPQMEGGEQVKGSMVDRMTTGQETQKTHEKDEDALQRHAEQALGE